PHLFIRKQLNRVCFYYLQAEHALSPLLLSTTEAAINCHFVSPLITVSCTAYRKKTKINPIYNYWKQIKKSKMIAKDGMPFFSVQITTTLNALLESLAMEVEVGFQYFPYDLMKADQI
uniref:Uncharacterized protein n=1 Tax=Romanomermis culicivorax TaxID=13658 RepID=A0A915JBK9_ROMCU